MKLMRKALAWILAVLLVVGMTACGTETREEGYPARVESSAPPTVTTTAPEAPVEEIATTAKENQTTTTTTGYTKNIQNGITTTTVTTTTKDKSGGKSIRILGVGNSFTVDSMRRFLFGILSSAGYTDITLGYLHIGGCSLDTHYDNLTNNKAEYEYWKNTDDEWVLYAGAPAAKAFGDAQWDVVTIQQVSTDSGRPASYKNLEKVVGILRQKEPQAKILWHMTWAYQQNSDHWAFAYYNKDQMTMYNAITATVQEQVLPLTTIDGVIPSGTAVQNLRTSSLGDTLTADGYHLSDTYGDYTAALTWYCTITGAKAETVTYRPESIVDQWAEIAAAVDNAVKTPYAVTPF